MTTTKKESSDGCDEKLDKQTFTVSIRNSLRRRLSTAKEHFQGIDRPKLVTGIMSLILVCLVAGVTVAQISQTTIANYGTVKVIGVSLYWDSACQNEVTSIAWGPIYPGTSIDRYVYVKNQGTTAETLSMGYSNFLPSAAASYFSLVWNCSDYVLSLNDVPCAKLTLSVQQNIRDVQDFSFAIVVQATA